MLLVTAAGRRGVSATSVNVSEAGGQLLPERAAQCL